MNFRERVYLITSEIPEGRVMGYGHVAAVAGSPRAARQVGAALKALLAERAQPSSPHAIPWWRVLRSNGQIALRGDPMRPPLQQLLLEEEGVEVKMGKVDMSRYGWLPDDAL